MNLLARLLLLVALALTIVPGLRPIAKAEPTSKPPTSSKSPSPIAAVLAHPAPAVALALSLPRCARPAQTSLLANIKCKPNDSACICSKEKNFITRLLTLTGKVCGQKDQKAVKDFGAVYCGLDPRKVKGPPGLAWVAAKSSLVGSKDTTCSKDKVGVARKTKTNTKTHITLPGKAGKPTVTYECSPLPSHTISGSQKKVGNETRKMKTDTKKKKKGEKTQTQVNGTAENTTHKGVIGAAPSARMENPFGGGLSAFGVVVLVVAVAVMECVFGEI